MSLLGSLFPSLFHPPATQAPKPTLEAMERELHGLVVHARERAGPNLDDPALQASQEDPEAREARWKDEAESARCRLESEIVELHQVLKTEIAPPRMERLSRLLRAHLVDPGEGSPIEQRIDHYVLRFLYDSLGDVAWNELERRMAAAGISWPVPQGLATGRTAEALRVALDAHLRSVHDWFVSTSPLSAAELIHGRVPAWEFAYPEEGGALWREIALRAVGAALRAQLLAAGVELWLWRPPDLDGHLRELLENELNQARQLVHQVVPGGSGRRLATYERDWWSRVPQLVWEYVGPRLQGGGSDVAVLADGVQQVDPVCGMALTADRVAVRLSHAGQTFFFCQRSCREQFERDLDRAQHPRDGAGTVSNP